jgi:aarF domain-containing kinase
MMILRFSLITNTHHYNSKNQLLVQQLNKTNLIRRKPIMTTTIAHKILASSCVVTTRRGNVILDTIKDIIRGLQLAFIFTPLAVLYPMSYFAPSTYYRYMTFSLEIAGPTFVKLGQWASTRRDIFPEIMCSSLFRLHNKTWTGAKCVDIPKYLSSRYRIETPAVGSGCIARVYGAFDRDSGRHVAIKIKHPGVNESVHRDVRILESVAYMISMIPTLKWISLYESAQEFSEYMKSQLDLNVEASNLKRFRRNFQDVKNVKFPNVVEHEENILVMDYVKGSCLSELMAMREDIFKNRKKIARLGLRSFLKMLLKDNLIHGDLHPGNIMVQKDNITFIDAGLAIELEDQDRKNFMDLFRAVSKGQGREAGRLILERSSENECSNPESFYDDVEMIVQDALSSDGGLRDVKIGSILGRVLSAVRFHRVKLDSKFVSLVVSISLLEGIGRELDPDIDVFGEALLVGVGVW